ncbi:MAG: hypothetical protein B7Y39_15320 [Bdellovibrio sp. 28-41-41]|nr:MAG: hypothetical protein B7Y39_15320 [Bdellovibrio sp. 28-41-41]
MAKAKKPAPKKTPAKKTSKPAMKAKPKAALTKLTKPSAKVAAKKPTASKAPAKKVTPAKAAAKPAVKSTPARAANTTPGKKSESYFKSYLKPLDDRMVVLVGANERVTPGGLFIPDTVTDVSGNFQGKVMAIGRGHMSKKGRVQPLDVALGDKVVFSQFAGSQIDVDGNNIMIIRESDVLGIVK